MNELIERLHDYMFLKMSHPHFGNIADDCESAATALEAQQAVVDAADKVFVLHSVGLDTDKEWAILSDALDTFNIAKLDQKSCDHKWIDARNEIVQSGEICLKCGGLRAGNQKS